MQFSKWSLGEKVDKSPRHPSKNIQANSSEHPNVIESNIYQIDNSPNAAPNKREMFNDKLSQRQIYSSGGNNPYLANNNYISDIEAQEQFLRPTDSNFTYQQKP